MQPLESYLKSLSKLLPADQREDILREISEDIQSEFEDKQAELGRPLTDSEQSAVLKRRGNPLVVAAGYRQNQGTVAFGRQWIGPVLFPFYTKVLAFNLGLTFLILVTIFVALSFGAHGVTLRDIYSNFLLQLFIQFTAVTVIFALIERHLANFPDHWNRAAVHERIHRKIATNLGEVSRFESVSIIIASAIALLWLRAVQVHPFLIFGPAAVFLRLAPVWQHVYLAIAALTVAGMLRAFINLVRPDWIRLRTVSRIVLDAAGLAVISILLTTREWVTLADSPAVQDAGYRDAVDTVNQSLFLGLVAAAVVVAVTIILNIVRLFRDPRHRAASRG